MRRLELVELEGIEGFFDWFKNLQKTGSYYQKAESWTKEKVLSAIAKAKQELLDIKRKVDKIFKTFPHLKAKYPEYEKLTKETEELLNAQIKEIKEVNVEGLGAVPAVALVVGGAVGVGTISLVAYLNKVESRKKEYLKLYSKIINDQNLTPTEKQRLIQTIQGQSSTESEKSYEGIAWILGLVVALVIIIVGLNLYKDLKR